MDVNYEVWGNPEDWRDASSYTYYGLGDFKRPKEGVNSYYNAYSNGSLVGGEVPTDLSLAFWGIGKGSILTKPMFLASYWDGGTIKTVAEPINDEEVSSVPCILGYASDGEGQYRLSWWNRYAPTDNPGEAKWSTGSVINIWSMYREIFTAFNYQKIMLVPFVRVALGSPTSGWNETYVSLKQYIDGMVTGGTYVNHTKILSIGYQLAIGDGEDNRSTGNKELSVNTLVNVKGSTRHWEGVKSNRQHDWKWFATEYGINTMLDSGMLNPGSYSYARSITPYRRFGAVDFSGLHNIGDGETGLSYKYCENYKEPSDTGYGQVPIPYYYDPDNDLWKINDSLPWNTNYADPFPYIECNITNKNQVRDYILEQIAYLGFPFVYDPALASRGKIGDIGVYLPVFDGDGITTGEYAEGTAALALPNAEWVDAREGSGYDPFKPPPVIKPVKQRPYITVYSYRTPQGGFDNHGLFILTPTRCTIVEALNGRYELSIEHPIDPEGRWEYIRENNIIKALGQLFTIRSVTQKWQGRSGKVTAKADHIFYQLADWWLERGNIGVTGRTVVALLNSAGSKMKKELLPGQTAYTYRYASDMTVPDITGDYRWDFLPRGMTPVDFLMGSNGVMEVCGGELHRDNFSFSLYEHKEGSKNNAFEIRVGKNLTGISRTIDASSVITYLKASNNYGQFYALSWVGQEAYGMPHYTVREKEFNYELEDLFYRDEYTLAYEMLQEDAKAYFAAYCAPLISYDIDLVDVKNNPEYEGLQGVDEFKVGNWGYIYDERIGGKIEIEITETTTDAMTGEVTNVLFGSKRSFTNPVGKTAIIDIEPREEEKGFVVMDAEGAFCYDSEGARIVEYEGV